MTTAIKPAAEFTAGQCGKCGIVNDVTRKFCSSCGASLRVPCLACGTSVAGWEKICGECGGNQPDLLAARTAELTQLQINAEKLLEELRFDEAKELLEGFRDLDQRFVDFSSWREVYEGRLRQVRESEEQRTSALVAEALQHEAAFDYQAAIHALEKIPPQLRVNAFGDADEAAQVILTRVAEKDTTASTLSQEVRQAISERKLDGLLAKVTTLLALRPNQADVAKVKRQLEERDAKLKAQAEITLKRTNDLLWGRQHQQAIDVLDRSGFASAKALQDATTLKHVVEAAVQEKRFGTARRTIEEFLARATPNSDSFLEAKQMLENCVQRRQKASWDGWKFLVLVILNFFGCTIVLGIFIVFSRLFNVVPIAFFGWLVAVTVGPLAFRDRHNKRLDA